ncbi:MULTISPECIES: acetyl-CoA C-acetyltransferase [unclassified Streptomyces]|uniref:acetyl-CoA C-acetyltransferase n=1 Tax=unclassified Streptomyces TaxID=2593676 RepID=UPI0001C1BFDC|nr:MULTISPECIES: acetyl-CoA C-acetyltransferase [unclassified Streptomyces]MYR65551.1 acetyl-CoA C-acyltransferase [Streptomyces sp. SID4939]MYS01870.1 acetyl-CoA C-acyltransferase [Streptomyces sp. SID4940]MYT67378.1 acetyl-CoA C-acyltransferase [Streptomyces sp. SID8357]MYT87936.1 acetyl-CoA C-acyltransferase [Streptomyces sp. SID8360]MYW40622.1 acetyl-CoA C-acyltransferase [Streptomyces sp. SID1]
MPDQTDVVICEPLRTPIGRFGGAFAQQTPAALAARVIAEVVARTGIDHDRIDEVILGHAYPTSDAPAIGRVAALDAGLPQSVTGLQTDRRCGSGLQAVLDAAMQIRAGFSDVVVAGGVDVMSAAPYYTHDGRWGIKGPGLQLHDSLARGRVTAGGAHHPVPGGMIETAENLRRAYGISRADQDALALRSQARAARAMKEGRYDAETVPVTVRTRKAETTVTADEHPRPDTTAEQLAALRPVMANSDPEATVTAGNASGQNDAAAACLVTSAATAERLGLTPLVRLVSFARAGVPAATMGLGPVPATHTALGRAGLTLADLDLIEINEAFAAQVLACTRELGLGEADHEQRINVNGSGVSLGHPVGATGARILATLAHEMHRSQARYGLETMCIGGGQGLAAVFERLTG